ncbi:MAG: PaeR7I family type II restriction endonuclease [Planctomycetaceae bacterium]
MDGFVLPVRDIIKDGGLPDDCIHTSTSLELPGYFRPEKKWDLIVVDGNVLVAAIEFKSQIGPSFGNNFNNRSEEAIGTAQDIWTAYREGAFQTSDRPWLCYVMMLEDCLRSTSPVSVRAIPIADDQARSRTTLRLDMLPVVVTQGGGESAVYFSGATPVVHSIGGVAFW